MVKNVLNTVCLNSLSIFDKNNSITQPIIKPKIN